MKVMITGASGMIGSTLFRVLSKNPNNEIFGIIRKAETRSYFEKNTHKNLIHKSEYATTDQIAHLLADIRPDVVINCIGVTKHLAASEDPLLSIPLNAQLPHQISNLSRLVGARFIQISTDCVFAGRKGLYKEDDLPDASDLYGRSKILGEVIEDHAITIRTSTIGPELGTSFGLLNWFFSQKHSCKGYENAYFSGFPTNVLAEIIDKYILTRLDINGIYHIASERINKYELLKLIRDRFERDIELIPDSTVYIDRSLNGTKFSRETGFQAPSWVEMIDSMYADITKKDFHV